MDFKKNKKKTIAKNKLEESKGQVEIPQSQSKQASKYRELVWDLMATKYVSFSFFMTLIMFCTTELEFKCIEKHTQNIVVNSRRRY